jgi:hypothetical protein
LGIGIAVGLLGGRRKSRHIVNGLFLRVNDHKNKGLGMAVNHIK